MPQPSRTPSQAQRARGATGWRLWATGFTLRADPPENSACPRWRRNSPPSSSSSAGGNSGRAEAALSAPPSCRLQASPPAQGPTVDTPCARGARRHKLPDLEFVLNVRDEPLAPRVEGPALTAPLAQGRCSAASPRPRCPSSPGRSQVGGCAGLAEPAALVVLVLQACRQEHASGYMECTPLSVQLLLSTAPYRPPDYHWDLPWPYFTAGNLPPTAAAVEVSFDRDAWAERQERAVFRGVTSRTGAGAGRMVAAAERGVK